MKKFLTILLLALVGMNTTSCEESGVEEPNNNIEQPNDEDNKGNDNDNESDVPENLFFVLDKESVTIASDGGSVDVIVYSNYKWEISGVSDWCTPSVKNGSANEDGQKVSFYADLTYDSREATFWFRCADEKIKFVVSQKLKEVINPDGDNTFDIPVEGGIAVISYQTSVDCEVIIPEEAQSWVSIANSRALVSESISLDVAANTTYSDRTVVVKVVAKYNDNLVVKYTINQEQKDAILADENNTFIVPGEGGDVQIDYLANVDCEIIIPEEVQNWITFVPETRGLVTKSATLRIAENTTYSDRTAVVMVAAKDNDNLAVEYTINQEQNDAVFADGDNTFTVPSKGGDVEIDYLANVDCEIIIPKEAQDWVAIVPETRGLVADTATLHVAENTTYSDRTAVVRMMAKDNDNWVVEYTINQKQKDAIIADGGNEFNIDGHEQQISIKHKTNIDCEVVIPAEAQDWITIAPATRGLETYTTTLNIAANDTGVQRQAIVKVVSVDNNELFAEYTISQEFIYLIKYTSTDGRIVEPYSSSAFDALILSNTYDNGVGIIEFSSPITTIGELAFYECDNLKSITIPNSVTTIGQSAFKGCSSLTSVNIHDSVTMIGGFAFYGCNSLSSVTIGKSVTTIGYQAFYGCSNLTSVTIPNSVTSIGYEAFYQCFNLTSVYISDIVAWCNILFYNHYANPLNDGAGLYVNNELVTHLIVPSGVTSIGNYAFYGCESLESIVIPNSVTTIGDDAFYGCSSITSIIIPDSVTEIGWSAFYGCSSLTSVTIPDSVTAIRSKAFSGCTGELIINSKIVETNYSDCNEPTWLDGSKFTRLIIGDSVTTIGNRVFYGCDTLTSITLGNNVTAIGDEAFYNCSGLVSVTIGGSVTTIGNKAFYGCSSLTSVYISNIAAWCNISFGSSSSNPLMYAHNLYMNNELVTDLIIPNGVASIGNYAFYDCNSLTSVIIPDSVTVIGDYALYECDNLINATIGDSVMEIGNKAFYNCDSLTSAIVLDGVTTIGDSTFYGCSSLTSVTIGNSVTMIKDNAFYGCSSLKSMTIPDSVTTIGEQAFYDCSTLTNVAIGDSVTEIGRYAFYGCSGLTNVTIGKSVTTIGYEAFSGCTGELIINSKIVETNYSDCNEPTWLDGSKFTSLIIGDNVSKIGDSAFRGCSSLTSVTIGNGVTMINDDAFYGCSNLTSLTIGNRVTTIGDYTFYGCSSLASVTIPDSVTMIGDKAFRGCDGLTRVIIGDSVTTIGNYAFYGCSSLKSMTIPDSVTTIGEQAFYDCSTLTNVAIGDSVTEIGYYAFCGCSSLASVTIGNSVTTIGDGAFRKCSSLTSVTIGNGVTMIKDDAFYGCDSLTSVTIPDSVTSIGRYAFNGDNLKCVYCKASTPPFLGELAFNDYFGEVELKIYVPAKSVLAYKWADGYWCDYTDNIVGYDF